MALPWKSKGTDGEEAFLITPELDKAPIVVADGLLHCHHSCLHSFEA